MLSHITGVGNTILCIFPPPDNALVPKAGLEPAHPLRRGILNFLEIHKYQFISCFDSHVNTPCKSAKWESHRRRLRAAQQAHSNEIL